MQKYQPQNHIPISGLILLAVGSVVLGVVVGALGYFISGIYYFLFIFPLALGIATAWVFSKLTQVAKVRYSIMTCFFGLTMGLLVAFAFYDVPYLYERYDFINYAQKRYQVSERGASISLDNYLIEDTGSKGLLGYMKLRAKEGDDYTNYLVFNSVPINEFMITMNSTWSWIYWMIESLFISIPAAWIGYEIGKRPFNKSTNEWYSSSHKQIGAVSLGDKNNLLAYLIENNPHGVGDLIVSEEELTHPMIEIFRRKSEKKKGDILISIQQTHQTDKLKIKTEVLSQWEIPQQEYELIEEIVNNKLGGNS
jgi:hypothetical protein